MEETFVVGQLEPDVAQLVDGSLSDELSGDLVQELEESEEEVSIVKIWRFVRAQNLKVVPDDIKKLIQDGLTFRRVFIHLRYHYHDW